MPRILFLSKPDVRRALPMQEAVEVMRAAFLEMSSGTATVPQRQNVEMSGGRALLMPVHIPSLRAFGVKVLTLFPENPSRGLPTIRALMMLFDGHEGTPLAVLDAEYLTALRTGAASGLATDLLARPNAATLAVIGAGAQARTQIEAVCGVRPISKIMVFDRTADRTSALIEEMRELVPCPVEAAPSPACVADCDIVCTVTTSIAPVLQDADVRPGTHLNAMGAYRSDMCELPHDTLARAYPVVDLRSSALQEAGDVLQAIAAGRLERERLVELGEIVAGRQRERTPGEEVTVFKSVGSAAQDLFAAHRAFANAKAIGLGTEVEL